MQLGRPVGCWAPLLWAPALWPQPHRHPRGHGCQDGEKVGGSGQHPSVHAVSTTKYK